MPEGLDDAQSAFQASIAPETVRSQPRDDGGRFAQTSRPEPIFGERRFEGDPLTGDTRDGGDDARLAAIERRIADGRAQKGDDEELGRAARRQSRQNGQSVSDESAQRRSAASDDRHQREAPEQIGSDVQGGGDDQDAEERNEPAAEDAEDEAARASERDAAAGPKYEVIVEGQPVEVTLPEALKGYIREQTLYHRLSKLNAERQTVEQNAAQIGQAAQVWAAKLAEADQLLAEFTPPEPDWDQEFARDPNTARLKQKAFAEIYQKRARIQADRQAYEQTQNQEYAQRSQAWAVQQFSEFVAEAKIPDKPALDRRLATMHDYARSLGFTDQEIRSVYDKRMLKVLNDAAEYYESRRNRPKPVAPEQGRTLVPGASTAPIGQVARRSLDGAQTKLAKSGKLDDAEAVFYQLIR
jgi:hypothetical protein